MTVENSECWGAEWGRFLFWRKGTTYTREEKSSEYNQEIGQQWANQQEQKDEYKTVKHFHLVIENQRNTTNVQCGLHPCMVSSYDSLTIQRRMPRWKVVGNLSAIRALRAFTSMVLRIAVVDMT